MIELGGLGSPLNSITPSVPSEATLARAKAETMSEEDVRAVDEARGAVVHTFNPSASSHDKAVSVGSRPISEQHPIRDHLAHKSTTGGLKELSIDVAGGPQPIPTVTVDDIDEATLLEQQIQAGEKVGTEEVVAGEVVGVKELPGSIPATPTQPGALPDWYKIGWRQASGIDEPLKGREQSLLADWVSEQYYGAWYHNAAVILFAVVVSRFIGIFRLGWGWTLILLAFCASYYDLSITRVRRAARDDIQRELVKTKLITESESADWINAFLHRFWRIYEPVLSATIVASVDAVLSTSTPAFLESIKMTTFTLGNKAPRIESVRTFPETPDDEVLMDFKISFTPNDVSDVTPNQQRFQTNPKIVLEVKIGKGFVSAPLPILLEDITFVGLMRIHLKLINTFPHVQTVGLSFLEKPLFDYVLKPLTGFDINNIPGLRSFIQDQVHATLAPMLYAPNVFTLNLEQLLSGAPLDSAIGVLQLKISNARGIKGKSISGKAPDPYIKVALAGREPVARTVAKHNDLNPAWNETKFILISSLSDVLSFTVWDENGVRKDVELGVASFELERLKADGSLDGLKADILDEGRVRGELRFDANFFPVLQPETLADGTLEPVPETSTGIVRLTIHQAKDLDSASITGLGHPTCNPYAKVFIGGSREPGHRTPAFKQTLSPAWESSYEFLVNDKESSTVTVQIVNDVDFAKNPVIGKVVVALTDLLRAKDEGKDWFPLVGCKLGRARLTASWKPLAMTGSLDGSSAFVPPIGIVRVLFKKAVDLKNVEAGLGGKSDPYVRVRGWRGNIKARTHVIRNNLNPEWDQIVYFPIHTLGEVPKFEVMDYESLGKDRSLGLFEVNLSELATSDPTNERTPYVSTGRKVREEKLQQSNGTYKGSLHYEIDFCPAWSLKGGVSFDPKEDEISAAINSTSPPPTATTDGISNVTSPKSLTNGLPITPQSAAISLPVLPLTPRSPQPRMSMDVAPYADKNQGVQLTREDLLNTPSGLLICQVVSGTLASRSRLELLTDDGIWPVFGTAKARSHKASWDMVGEAFIKELDLGRITLRLNENDEGSTEKVIAQLDLEAKLMLEQSLDTPQDFTLLAIDGSGRNSTVRIQSKFVPVDIRLAPRESANNMGRLRVDLLSGEGLKSVDRNGKSDPYVVLHLGDKIIHKSETKKKTLSPVWNESFETDVESRVAAKFKIEVMDWDRVGSAEVLGTAMVDLAALEPFEASQLDIPLDTQGTIRIRMVFQPAILVKARKNTSTFSSAGRAMTTVGHIPLGVGKGVAKGAFKGAVGLGHGVGAVGSFAGHGVSGVRRKLTRRKNSIGESILVEEIVDDQTPLEDSASIVNDDGYPLHPPVSTIDFANSNGNGSAPLAGKLQVTVVGGRDLSEEMKTFVSCAVGDKIHKTRNSSKTTTPEWEETHEFGVSGEQILVVSLSEHHAFGRSKLIGSTEVQIFKKISLAAPQADVEVTLREGPVVKLRLGFQSGSSPSSSSLLPASPRSNQLARTNSSTTDGKGTAGSKGSRFLRRNTKGEQDRPE